MKIVIVDDSPAIQRSFGRVLGSIAGVDVVGCARDVTDALSLIEAVKPDVVVLDVNLLDGDKGIDVLRYVKRQRLGIRVVVLSDFDSSSLRRTYLDAGADAFYDKSTEFIQARDWIEGCVPGLDRSSASP